MLHTRAFLVSVLGALALVAMIGTAGASGAHRPAVSVSPATAGPRGHFTVSFHAPQPAGRTGVEQTSYTIKASTHAASGCRSSLSHTITFARKGAAEHVRLAAGGSGRLCAGIWKGSVTFVRTPNCGPPTLACPAFALFGQRVGTFRFRVT